MTPICRECLEPLADDNACGHWFDDLCIYCAAPACRECLDYLAYDDETLKGERELGR